MAFTTPVSAKRPDLARRCWLALAALFCLAPLPSLADDFIINAIDIRLQDDVYQLNAHIDYRFTKEVREALYNGVPITVQLDIEIQRKRRWWLDADMATLEQRYRLQYHALSHQYQIHNLNSGGFYTFPNLSTALYALGEIDNLPLLDRQLVKEDEEYEVLIRSELDIEALPSPLRPLAYITPAWRLDSDWYTWPLKP